MLPFISRYMSRGNSSPGSSSRDPGAIAVAPPPSRHPLPPTPLKTKENVTMPEYLKKEVETLKDVLCGTSQTAAGPSSSSSSSSSSAATTTAAMPMAPSHKAAAHDSDEGVLPGVDYGRKKIKMSVRFGDDEEMMELLGEEVREMVRKETGFYARGPAAGAATPNPSATGTSSPGGGRGLMTRTFMAILSPVLESPGPRTPGIENLVLAHERVEGAGGTGEGTTRLAPLNTAGSITANAAMATVEGEIPTNPPPISAVGGGKGNHTRTLPLGKPNPPPALNTSKALPPVPSEDDDGDDGPGTPTLTISPKTKTPDTALVAAVGFPDFFSPVGSESESEDKATTIVSGGSSSPSSSPKTKKNMNAKGDEEGEEEENEITSILSTLNEISKLAMDHQDSPLKLLLALLKLLRAAKKDFDDTTAASLNDTSASGANATTPAGRRRRGSSLLQNMSVAWGLGNRTAAGGGHGHNRPDSPRYPFSYYSSTYISYTTVPSSPPCHHRSNRNHVRLPSSLAGRKERERRHHQGQQQQQQQQQQLEQPTQLRRQQYRLDTVDHEKAVPNRLNRRTQKGAHKVAVLTTLTAIFLSQYHCPGITALYLATIYSFLSAYGTVNKSRPNSSYGTASSSETNQPGEAQATAGNTVTHGSITTQGEEPTLTKTPTSHSSTISNAETETDPLAEDTFLFTPSRPTFSSLRQKLSFHHNKSGGNGGSGRLYHALSSFSSFSPFHSSPTHLDPQYQPSQYQLALQTEQESKKFSQIRIHISLLANELSVQLAKLAVLSSPLLLPSSTAVAMTDGEAARAALLFSPTRLNHALRPPAAPVNLDAAGLVPLATPTPTTTKTDASNASTTPDSPCQSAWNFNVDAFPSVISPTSSTRANPPTPTSPPPPRTPAAVDVSSSPPPSSTPKTPNTGASCEKEDIGDTTTMRIWLEATNLCWTLTSDGEGMLKYKWPRRS